MRLASTKVNTHSRNPDVLPTFLRVIPKWHHRHPQFFPKVRTPRSHHVRLALGIAAAVAALSLTAAAIVGLDSHTAGARTASEDGVSPQLYLSTGALGAAAGDDALGLRTSYYEPPALTDPAQPGFTINSGADQPDPFMYQAGGRYYLFTSQDLVPTNVPVRSGTVVGRWGPPTDALPDPPAWAQPGVMWAPDVARFGDHYMLYFSSMLRGVSPGTMCIGDAISTAVAGPYLASPQPFVCQQSLGGSIDPRVFVDASGKPSMVWKSEQNARSYTTDTEIWIQPLSADGMHLLGQPTAIFRPDQSWQGHIVGPRSSSWCAARTTCSIRGAGSTSLATRSGRPAAPARPAPARTCPPRRCWPRTHRARDPARSRSSRTRPACGCSTPRLVRPSPSRGRRVPSPWRISGSGPRGPTWPRRSRSPGRPERPGPGPGWRFPGP